MSGPTLSPLARAALFLTLLVGGLIALTIANRTGHRPSMAIEFTILAALCWLGVWLVDRHALSQPNTGYTTPWSGRILFAAIVLTLFAFLFWAGVLPVK